MSEFLNRLYKKYKISTGIFATIFISVFIIIMLLFFIIKTATGYFIDEHIKKYLTYIHSEFDTNITEFNRQIHMYSLPLTLDNNLVLVITDDQLTSSQKYEKIAPLIFNSTLNNDLIEKTAVITVYGENFCYSDDNAEFMPVDTGFIGDTTGYDIYVYDVPVNINGNSYIVFGKKIANYYSGFNMGYVEYFVNEDKLYSLFKDSSLHYSETFLVCGGNIISHENKSRIGKQLYLPGMLFSDEESITELTSGKIIGKFTASAFDGKNIDMISILDRDSYYNVINVFNIFIIVICIFVLVISVIVAHILSKKITNSISSLNTKINKYPEKITVSENNELVSLEKRFLLFEEQIDGLIEKIEIEKKKQKSAELAALQAQINPHFVYNALDSMSWIAKIYHQEQIENLSTALAQYFRLGLHNGDNFIMIKDEINHVKSYITVEQIRFPDTFDVNFDISEKLNELMTLKIIIQPIVENCIKHAFNNMPGKGMINIQGYLEGNDIIFKISDNGCGMDFNPLTESKPGDFKVGYGVKNVQNRIELEYGKGYGLSYESSLGNGTTVTVKIKKR